MRFSAHGEGRGHPSFVSPACPLPSFNEQPKHDKSVNCILNQAINEGRLIGAGEIVDHHGVGAAESVDIDPLDIIDVHRDAADIAGQAHAPAVGRDVDALVELAAAKSSRSMPA